MGKKNSIVNTKVKYTNSLGKSTKDGKSGRNDPGDINPGKNFKKESSNLQLQTDDYMSLFSIATDFFTASIIVCYELVVPVSFNQESHFSFTI